MAAEDTFYLYIEEYKDSKTYKIGVTNNTERRRQQLNVNRLKRPIRLFAEYCLSSKQQFEGVDPYLVERGIHAYLRHVINMPAAYGRENYSFKAVKIIESIINKSNGSMNKNVFKFLKDNGYIHKSSHTYANHRTMRRRRAATE